MELVVVVGSCDWESLSVEKFEESYSEIVSLRVVLFAFQVEVLAHTLVNLVGLEHDLIEGGNLC